MNTWQVLRQLKDTLTSAAWTDGVADVVFGSVIVAAAIPEKGFGRLRFPLAHIIPDSAEADEEEPELVLQDFVLRIVQRVENDAYGETAILGGARSNGQGSSDGRGILEIEEEALKSIGAVSRLGGIQIRERWRSAVAASEVERLGNVVLREIGFRSWNSTLRSYPAPSRLAGAVPGGGVVNLSWSLPTTRFDTYALVLRRAAGSTAPATATSGTGVTVGALVTSVSDTPGAGTFSYALFMGYDEINDPTSSADRYSSGDNVTVVAT
jgi:hypothetical protein